MPPLRLLIADDNRDVVMAGTYLFEPEGFEVVGVYSPKEVLESINKQEFDVALIDLNYSEDTTSGKEGLSLLDQIQKVDPDLPVLVTTAWATVDNAVEAMRRGARDFIEKPWDNSRLLAWVKTQGRLTRELRKGHALEAENKLLRKSKAGVEVVHVSAPMMAICEVLNQVAPTDATVLITGENGTGKGVVAQRVHDLSKRAEGPFISVNMGSIPEALFESELFGHVKGAFTDAKKDRIGRVELAAGGTLFLDEIGNLPLGQQAKLLRFLETGEFERVGSSQTRESNARIIAATNANLEASVKDGSFRQDLYYRLATVPVTLPPLRERREDIVPLAESFLQRFAIRYKKKGLRLSESFCQTLIHQAWPGNARELSHAIERAVILGSDGHLAEGSLDPLSTREVRLALDDMSLEEVERYLVERALRQVDGNVTEAALRLGMSRATLYRRIKEYGI